MTKLQKGIIAGLIFGGLDIIPMFFMDGFDNLTAAVSGAFINRFAIGLLIFTTNFPVQGWLKGLILGILLSLPDAIITGAWGPIMGTGIVGGLIIGFIEERTTKET